MLFIIFNQIRTLLKPIAGVKDVQWYNAQYDGTIVAEPLIFVEFPRAIELTPISKLEKRAPLRIRIHVVSKAVSGINGAIPDESIIRNEAIATAVKEHLNGIKIEGLTAIRFAGWQHWHRWQGWMVTFVEFEPQMSI